ncbi:hypothetical protein MG293_020215 [Ovis ammon polii]|uniref:Uncharacterized protein n=1 Tax=Ovis ammon polii TaxID=230172 RepID=A0AAD4TN36_OVIAM|nr:hypothetical protein MG293_020215 [Ovis ammon polii]
MLRATSLEGLIKRDEDLVGIAVELSPHPRPEQADIKRLNCAYQMQPSVAEMCHSYQVEHVDIKFICEQTCLDPASPPASTPFPSEHATHAQQKGPEEASNSPGCGPDSLVEEENKTAVPTSMLYPESNAIRNKQ